jgi:glucokinase
MSPWFVGIEVGGTKLQVALGRGDGQLAAIERRQIQPEDGAQGLLLQIAEACRSLLGSSLPIEDHPVALGIGFGGPVDPVRGIVLKSHQVEGWDEFPLAAWARETLKIPLVALQNDADTAGLGEARFGAGQGKSPLFYVTIGSGIGGGLIIDGEIYRGAGLGAAEVGHLWIDDDFAPPRRLESIASGWSIGEAGRLVFDESDQPGLIETLAAGRREKVDAPLLARAAEGGDPRAIAIYRIATRAVGRALAHAVTLLGPRRIILGGGVSLLGESLWFAPIRDELTRRGFPPFQGSFDIVPAQLGQEVVLHGSLALASDLWGRT